ncbi:MAG: TonB family protein [Pyrinomonadaceae bacterium]
MRPLTSSTLSTTRFGIFAIVTLLTFAFVISGLSFSARAQGIQLSLADIVIALRSKKATLPDRNKILIDAVQTRGTTFAMTPEIERELAGTGADRSLLDSIRQRGQMVKISAVIPAPVEQKAKIEPAALPVQQDFAFYEKRGNENKSKGNFEAAVNDFTRAIEMNSSDIDVLLGRAESYFNRNSYTLAIADYSKAIELDPKNAGYYIRRGEAQEKRNNVELAVADYKKALEQDAANESAKSSLSRLQPEPPKAIEKTETKTEAPQAAAAIPLIPDFVLLGQLSESKAVKLVKPVYPQLAFKSNIGGKVTVDVEIDVNGNVTSAKANGSSYLKQSSEEAALKSKFKPTMSGNQAVKAKGYIIYNFLPVR